MREACAARPQRIPSAASVAARRPTPAGAARACHVRRRWPLGVGPAATAAPARRGRAREGSRGARNGGGRGGEETAAAGASVYAAACRARRDTRSAARTAGAGAATLRGAPLLLRRSDGACKRGSGKAFQRAAARPTPPRAGSDGAGGAGGGGNGPTRDCTDREGAGGGRGGGMEGVGRHPANRIACCERVQGRPRRRATPRPIPIQRRRIDVRSAPGITAPRQRTHLCCQPGRGCGLETPRIGAKIAQSRCRRCRGATRPAAAEAAGPCPPSDRRSRPPTPAGG